MNPPESVLTLQQYVEYVDGVLFVTPEYNRGIPGVLKNAIDWCSRPTDHNRWKDKHVAIIGASSGKSGSINAQTHLKSICNFLGMRLMKQPEILFNLSAANIEKDGIAISGHLIQKFLYAFESWIKRN
jgi:chromate reductase